MVIFLLQCTLCIYAAQPQNDSVSNSSTSDTPSNDASPIASIILYVIVGALFFSGLVLVALRMHLASFCFGINLTGGGGGGGVGGLNRPPQGLSREVIDAFPTCLYEDVNKLHGLVDRELECAICLNDFQPHQALRLLPECSHIFHPQCIDPWLLSQATCPICRSTIIQHSSTSNTSDVSEDDDHNNASLIMDPFPSVIKSPINQDLEHGTCQSQSEYSTTIEEIGTTKVEVTAILSKSHSTGHTLSLMNACEPSNPFYSLRSTRRSKGSLVRGRIVELNLSGGEPGSPLSDSGVSYV